MKKYLIDFKVSDNCRLHDNYSLLKLKPTDGRRLPEILPGQFVQIAVPDSRETFLRRPISVNRVDRRDNSLWLLIRNAGPGTRHLIALDKDAGLNVLLPLGNGFSMPQSDDVSPLLVGGGVGVAPLLYFGEKLAEAGYKPRFLLGARSKNDVLELDEFRQIGEVYVATEDGSLGQKGLVTHHEVLNGNITHIYCCGPAPMMKAVASIASRIGAQCEVSLENMMACGLGACLCCVEKTVKGNVCVCTEGPVFNINQLTWQI